MFANWAKLQCLPLKPHAPAAGNAAMLRNGKHPAGFAVPLRTIPSQLHLSLENQLSSGLILPGFYVHLLILLEL